MKLGSANLLKAGKRELRSLGDDCDDACFPAYCCGNFELHGICRGFKLLNGENRKKLNAMLTDDDVLYIESCMRMIQNGHNEDVLVPEVLRYLKRPEDHSRESGFTAMLAAARSSNPTSQHTEPTEPRSMSGFLRMLEESSKKVSIEEAVQRALHEIEADEKKYRPIRREMGFGAMLEAVRPAKTTETLQSDPQTRLGFLRMLDTTYQQHVENGSVETHDRIPCDFGEMLAAAFPHGTPTTPDDKPHVRRGMGFANMLRGAAEGTE